MESLEAKKVRLLGRFISSYSYETNMYEANKVAVHIINLLDEVEQAHWTRLEELNAETHCGEVYGD